MIRGKEQDEKGSRGEDPASFFLFKLTAMTTRSKSEVSAIVEQLHTIEKHVKQLQETRDAAARRLALGSLENSVEELLIKLRTILDES